MWAIPKEVCVEYVEFTGIHEAYPAWFMDLLLDGRIFEDGSFGFTYLSKDECQCMDIIPGTDVVIKNKWGQIMVVREEIFDIDLTEVGTFLAGPRKDMIEYCYYANLDDLEMQEQEDWYLDAWSEGYIYEEYGCPYYLDAMSGAVPFVEYDIVLKNDGGEIRSMNTEAFADFFYTI